MKKSVLIAIGIVAIAALLGVSLLFINANNIGNGSAEDTSPKSIAKDYARIRAEIEGGHFSSASRGAIEKEYVPILRRIAEGDRKYAKEYAKLFKEITSDPIEFEADEVFSIAADYSEFYAQMGEGTDDFGVQHIKIIEDNSGKLSLNIDYIFSISSYNVRMLEKGEKPFWADEQFSFDGESLGEYQIEIQLNGATISEKMYKNLSAADVEKLKDVPVGLWSRFNIMVRSFDDYAFIYIGSDEPINIEEQDFTKVNSLKGSIEIALEK